ncbi:MAG: hypothetical protein MUC97_08040 [Bernardetiaceae bacterium]|nr:hypothetical protein [Bernardetiaceae bacterium]
MALALMYLVYDSVNGKIQADKEVKRREAEVIERLKEIREAQKLFQQVNGRYTGSWDSLKTFIAAAEVPNVQKREEIQKGLQSRRGGDSIKVYFDTLGKEKAIDKLFPPDKYPNFQIATLDQIPGWNDPAKTFTLTVQKLEQKGGLKVDVIEVVDAYPFDPSRKDDSPLRKRRRLRFGALDEVTLTGNWED